MFKTSVLAMALVLLGGAAASAADVRIETVLDASGGIVGALNSVGDDLCPSATTPGCDVSQSDARVRTNDAVSYAVSVQVDPPGDDVFVRVRFKPGLIASDLPGTCDPFNSSITGNGSSASPSEVHCALGFRSSWASTLNFVARVDGLAPNGLATGLDFAEIGGTNSPLTRAAASPTTGQVVTAVPRINLQKRNHSYYARTRDDVSGVDIAFRLFVGAWDQDRNGNPADNPDPNLGHENVTAPISFIEDLSGVAPNAYLVSCASSSSQAFPYPDLQSGPANRSVSEAGTISCANTGPSATGQQTVGISGADLSMVHYPTQLRNGAAIPATRRYASYGVITVFVPLSDIDAAGGTLVATNTFSGLDLTSISGQANYGGVGEITTDNTTSQTLQNRGGSFSHTHRCFLPGTPSPAWCNNYWASAPTNASTVSAGDGVVEPGQTFVSYTYYRNLSFIGDTEAAVCTVLDSRYIEPVAAANGSPAYCAGQCGTLGTDYVIEYGRGYVDASFRDASPQPDTALRDECNAGAAAAWTTNFATAQAQGPITKIRMRRLTELPPSRTHALGMQLRTRDAAGLSGVPNGTLVKSWGTAKATTSWADFRPCRYEQGSYPAPSHTTNSCGDRLALTRALARIRKTTEPGNAINVVEAGGTVRFSLAPTFTSIGGSITEAVQIVDELPVGAQYVPGTAVQGGAPFEPVLSGSPATGQVLTWNLGTLGVNTAIAPISFDVSVSSAIPNGTQLTNVARIETVADISDAPSRSSSRGVTVTAPRSMRMDKTVDQSLVPRDGSVVFTVSYENATNTTFGIVDIIDKLPFVGDQRFPATAHSGTTELGTVTAQTPSAQFYVTRAAPALLASDPSDATNDLASGATKWCPMTASAQIDPSATPSSGGASSLCPATPAQVTGLRLIDTAPLPAGQTRDVSLEFKTVGSVGDDVFANQAQGTADTITLSPISPTAYFAVEGVGELQAVKSVAMLQTSGPESYAIPGSEVVYTFTIRNVGDGPINDDSMVLLDALPGELEFWNGDFDAGQADTHPGTDRIGFVQTQGSGVSLDAATDVRFGVGAATPTAFSQCTAVPQDETFRDDLTTLCINPRGVLANGTPGPEIALKFRARIK